ncbi:probable inactive nicotinamidase At3g16190 [Papaver somniferum]|uniref:probable inactive nicotinamidase At3g16190 n=1 Tax=Papaver somniferum TaxID=3469 RepID=UPI000E6FC2C2|nr:probable inactive nicotinamidase At3g16190 [Papaver somniferum]
MAMVLTNTALVVLDMQKYFVGPGSQAFGQAIVPSVIEAVDIARKRGVLVVWVVREHDRLGRDIECFRRHMYGDNKIGPVAKGSKGAELVDGLVITGDDYKLVKTRFSAFFATNLDSFLRSSCMEKLVVVGVQTPNCIRQTVFDAVSLDYKSVAVITDATAASTPEVHEANLFDMKQIGIDTPTLQEWCESDA